MANDIEPPLPGEGPTEPPSDESLKNNAAEQSEKPKLVAAQEQILPQPSVAGRQESPQSRQNLAFCSGSPAKSSGQQKSSRKAGILEQIAATGGSVFRACCALAVMLAGVAVLAIAGFVLALIIRYFLHIWDG